MIELIFFLPGVIFFFSGIPQTIRLLKTKRSADISALTYALTVFAISIIFIDAVVHQNWGIAFSNGVSMLLTSTNLFLIIKYK